MSSHATLIAATTTTTSPPTGVLVASSLVAYVLSALALWGVFRKAGEPPWAGFVPFYNNYLLTKIAGYNGWLFLLLLIPVVGFIWSIFVAIGVGKAFGKGGAFSFFLLWLLSIIGYFVVGYGSAQYVGPGGRRAYTNA